MRFWGFGALRFWGFGGVALEFFFGRRIGCVVGSVLSFLGAFTLLDYAALAWFALCQLGYGHLVGMRRDQSGTFVNGIFAQRERWMRVMAGRELRMIDMMILQSFNQMTGFFATTSVLILGGLSALLGLGEAGRASLQSYPIIAETSIDAWVMKIGVLLVLFISAFFNFIWAQRLNQYLAVAIGATPMPDDVDQSTRSRQVELTTILANRASINSYRGMHAYYFAIAALTWFIHAGVFMVATTLVVLALYRREHISVASQAIRSAALDDVAGGGSGSGYSSDDMSQ